jgi:hypothetical protein
MGDNSHQAHAVANHARHKSSQATCQRRRSRLAHQNALNRSAQTPQYSGTMNLRSTEAAPIDCALTLRVKRRTDESVGPDEPSLSAPHVTGDRLCAGIVDVPEYGVRAKRGDFEPLISEDLFYRVQSVLSGRVPTMTSQQRAHPDFPHRAFVRCESCWGCPHRHSGAP